MRCFIAVDIDPSMTQKITELQNKIKNLDVKPTEESNLHFTLKFLGDITETTINKVKNSLAEIAASTNAFSINLSGIGIFPGEKYIRVVWVGADDKEFINLHDAVNTSLANIFKREKSVPHLTIARVRSDKDNAKIMDFVKLHANTEIGSMIVDKIKLKKSTLTREGPIYEDVAVFNLCGN